MIYLGIDYGEKRIGLAKAESEIRIATPLRTIKHGKDILNKLADILEEEEIGEIVLGIPVSFDGQENKFATSIREFGETIKKELNIQVHFQNEMLTTKQSQRDGVGDLDASSATLILQSFLDQLGLA